MFRTWYRSSTFRLSGAARVGVGQAARRRASYRPWSC
jgi:hypothetical protein